MCSSMKAASRPPYSRLRRLNSKSTLPPLPRAGGSAAVETLTRARQMRQQRRGREVLRAHLPAVVQQAFVDDFKADLIGMEHRAAAVGREAQALQPDDVDLVRPRYHALLDEACSLIDHGIKAALEDFRIGDGAPRDAARGAVPGDEGAHLRVRQRAALRVVAVPARPALLPEAAEGVQLLEQVRGALARGEARPARLARGEHDIQAAQVRDRERSERKPELHQHAVDLLGLRALL